MQCLGEKKEKKTADRYMLIIFGSISLLERTALFYKTEMPKQGNAEAALKAEPETWTPSLDVHRHLGQVLSIPPSVNARKNPVGRGGPQPSVSQGSDLLDFKPPPGVLSPISQMSALRLREVKLVA